MEISYKNCRLCARRCGVDRTVRAGRCGMTAEIKVARAALHMWEEPCLSGTRGAGAVFFSGCPLGCVFCQNRPIALGKAGRAITTGRLAEIFLELQEKGAHNIDLVTPTHYVPSIIEAVEGAGTGLEIPGPASLLGGDGREGDRASAGDCASVGDRASTGDCTSAGDCASAGDRASAGDCASARDCARKRLEIPGVYDTAAYECPETILSLKDTVDIWLPDLKYDEPELADKLARAPDYFETACRAIDEMVAIAGPCVFDGEGLLKRGVIVRHLILPGHTRSSIRILKYLHETYGNAIIVSVMNQYTPMPGVEAVLPELGRKVTRREYERVLDAALEMGLERAYYQEGGTALESFIPAFDGEGV